MNKTRRYRLNAKMINEIMKSKWSLSAFLGN